MDVILDEEIHKCLDALDTLLIQDLAPVDQKWKQEEENDEKKKSIEVLNCIHKLLDSNDRLKNNTSLIFILKCIFQQHKRLFDNLDYEQEQFTGIAELTDLPIESYSLRKYWKSIYPQLSKILIENLIQNQLDDLNKQFRFSEILEFFLLVERTNFWQFYQQIRKERLIVISRTCTDIQQLIEQLVRTIDYEIYLVCNYRYIQNFEIEFTDYILIYSNVIKGSVVNQLDSIKSQSTSIKISVLLNTISELNKFDEIIKNKSKLWDKLDLPNSVDQRKIQFDWKEYFVKKDYFNFLLNELNKELNLVTSEVQEEVNDLIVSINDTKILKSFLNIVKVLERYNLIHIKQLKKAFLIVIEVNINQFIQSKFSRLLKRVQLKEIYLYLNTLYYIKESFSNYGIDSNKINELISDLECEYKAKHLYVLNLNIKYIEYYICYLNSIQINLSNLVNFNPFQSQKLYQDLVQEALIQLGERDLQNEDLIVFLSNLPNLLKYVYDNDALFILNDASNSSFKKIVDKFFWKSLFKIGILNAPLKGLNEELSKIDKKTIDTVDDYKYNYLNFLNPTLSINLSYYHAQICNQKSIKHFIFICRPFIEFKFKFTIDLINHLIKCESFLINNSDKQFRKNRNRLLKAIFNLVVSNVAQLNPLASIILPIIQDQRLNFDCIQFELLLDDSLYKKHSTKLNQLDWIFSLVKLVKQLISTQLDIILNNFLYKYIDLVTIIELDSSVQQIFSKLNLKFLISESYLLDEFTESIFKLVCDCVLILPNGLFYSLELISKDLKSNDVLIFNSLTTHIILFAICKLCKSRLKRLLNHDTCTIVYSKIVGNLLSWLTFPEDYGLNKYRNKFNDLVLRRKMNLNLDYIQLDENQELASLLRVIEMNYDNYSKDIDLLENFLASNDSYLDAKLNNLEFNETFNLNYPMKSELQKEININEFYKQIKLNSDQFQNFLGSSINYDQLMSLIRIKTNKNFIRNNLIKRSDFSSNLDPSDQRYVSDLKKIFQIP